ncbi:MAG: hypothetical protein AAB686_00405 [Patescibacteria group bacterium]
MFNSYPNLVSLLLRVGLAFVFIYAAVASLTAPENWIGYIPIFVKNILGTYQFLFLKLFSVGEIILALWLLWGRYVKYAAIISFLLLAGMILFNLAVLDVVFRDVGLALTALALFVLSRSEV